MDTFKVLLAGDDGQINETINQFLEQENGIFILFNTQSIDDTLETIVTENPDFCLICDKNGTTIKEILTNLSEAGLKIPIIGIVPPEQLHLEGEHVKLGSKGVLCNDASLDSSLRLILRHLSGMKYQQIIFREEKEKMVAQFIDLQDVHQRTEEQSTNLVVMAEDLASAKEQLETLNQEKDKFFSIIAHDLRSPFTSIMGYTELLASMAETLKPDQVKSYSNNVNEAAQNVFRLLENLLDWARMEQGHMTFSPQPNLLKDTCAQAIQPLLSVAVEKGIHIKNNLDREQAVFDKNMIETVIRNLVNNAIKFTDKGCITLYCDDLGDQFRINVQDTGQGMNKDVIQGLFSIEINTTTKGTAGEKGSGLGLILCKQLVEKNGGVISVISEPRNGSTFSFTLPIEVKNE